MTSQEVKDSLRALFGNPEKYVDEWTVGQYREAIVSLLDDSDLLAEALAHVKVADARTKAAWIACDELQHKYLVAIGEKPEEEQVNE
jgi:hypothetical protein